MKKQSYFQLFSKIFLTYFFLNVSFEDIERENKQPQKHDVFLKTFEGKTVETERLYISPTTIEDLDFLAPHILDETAMRGYDSYSIWPKTIEEAKEYLAENLEGDKVYFTIKLKETNAPIGQIGFSFSTKDELWVCYWLSTTYQQKGYMTESVLPLTKIIFENCNDLDILHIRVLKTNTPSIKIATKICNFINKNDQYRYKEYEGGINVPGQDKKFFMKYPVIHFKLFKKKLWQRK